MIWQNKDIIYENLQYVIDYSPCLMPIHPLPPELDNLEMLAASEAVNYHHVNYFVLIAATSL